jgi:hypothetical protein
MDTKRLRVSNPPHDNIDPMAAAVFFGLTAAEVRMKANYSVPEIWFTQDEREIFDETASGLAEAGLKTVTVDGQDIADLGGPEPVASVAFDEAGLKVDLGDSGLIVNYSDSVIGVFGRPEPTEEPGRSSLGRMRRRTPVLGGTPVAPGFAPFLDLYVMSD